MREWKELRVQAVGVCVCERQREMGRRREERERYVERKMDKGKSDVKTVCVLNRQSRPWPVDLINLQDFFKTAGCLCVK